MESGPTEIQQETKVEEVVKYEPNILSLEKKDDFEPWRYGEDHEYIPEQSDVVEKVEYREHDITVNKYFLVSEVAGLDYFFKMNGEKDRSPFNLAFKTKAYEYATTNLDNDGTKVLFEKIADYLETAYVSSSEKIDSITISPDDSSFSVHDVEECISDIVRNTSKYSEEDLRENYKGFKVFRLYLEIFGKEFEGSHDTNVSRASARSRYFKMQFKKYLKNWEIDEETKKYMTFCLNRKKSLSDKPIIDKE